MYCDFTIVTDFDLCHLISNSNLYVCDRFYIALHIDRLISSLWYKPNEARSFVDDLKLGRFKCSSSCYSLRDWIATSDWCNKWNNRWCNLLKNSNPGWKLSLAILGFL